MAEQLVSYEKCQGMLSDCLQPLGAREEKANNEIYAVCLPFIGLDFSGRVMV
jgi:hypothetical protein